MNNVLLRHITETAAKDLKVLVIVFSIDKDPSDRGRTKPVQGVHEGRFTGAASADNRHELFWLDGERNIVEQDKLVVVDGLGDANGVEPQLVRGRLGDNVRLVDKLDTGNLDQVARLNPHRVLGLNPLAVDKGAVGAAEVLQYSVTVRAVPPDDGVVARNRRVIQHKGVIGGAAYSDLRHIRLKLKDLGEGRGGVEAIGKSQGRHVPLRVAEADHIAIQQADLPDPLAFVK